MNCKEGDLAIIIKGEQSGKLVKCLSLTSKENLPVILQSTKTKAIWKVDQLILWIAKHKNGTITQLGGFSYAVDSYLFPVRPDEITSLSEEELLL